MLSTLLFFLFYERETERDRKNIYLYIIYTKRDATGVRIVVYELSAPDRFKLVGKMTTMVPKWEHGPTGQLGQLNPGGKTYAGPDPPNQCRSRIELDYTMPVPELLKVLKQCAVVEALGDGHTYQ